MKTARFLALAALLLGLGAVARAADPCHGQCLPTGTANETQAVPTVTEGWPSVRATIWCISATVPCQGTVTLEANTCPTCPFGVQVAVTNPKIPDATGRVCAVDNNGNYICDVYLEPTMYSYRCALANYATGTHGCQIQIIK